MSTQGDVSRSIRPALKALRKVQGVRYKKGLGGAFALVGYYGRGRRGRKPRWVKQTFKRRGRLQLSANIPLPRIRKGLFNIFS